VKEEVENSIKTAKKKDSILVKKRFHSINKFCLTLNVFVN